MLNEKQIKEIVKILKDEIAEGRYIAISPQMPKDCGGYSTSERNTFITGYSFKGFKFYENFSFDSKDNFCGALLLTKEIYQRLGLKSQAKKIEREYLSYISR